MKAVDADKLRELRLLHGYTQDQLGRFANIRAATIGRYESWNGPRRLEAATLAGIAGAFGTTPARLLDPDVSAQDIYEAHMDARRAVMCRDGLPAAAGNSPHDAARAVVCVAQAISAGSDRNWLGPQFLLAARQVCCRAPQPAGLAPKPPGEGMRQGDRPRDVRKFLGYSAKEVAEALGHTRIWLQGLESSPSRLPDGVLQALLDLYVVDRDDFLNESVPVWRACQSNARMQPLEYPGTAAERSRELAAIADLQGMERVEALRKMYGLTKAALCDRARFSPYVQTASGTLKEYHVDRLNVLFALTEGELDAIGRPMASGSMQDALGELPPVAQAARGLNLLELYVMDQGTTGSDRDRILIDIERALASREGGSHGRR